MAMARVSLSTAQANPRFNIFEDSLSSSSHTDNSARGMLQELPIDNSQNIINSADITPESLVAHLEKLHIATPPEQKSVRARLGARGSQRRPAIASETFEPLSVVEEETSTILDLELSANTDSPCPAGRRLQTCTSRNDNRVKVHPLIAAEVDCTVRQQIQKHLAGQFEWLVSYPAPASSVSNQSSPFNGDDSHDHDHNIVDRQAGRQVYGCNLLSRKKPSASTKATTGCPLANTFTLVATRLEGDDLAFSGPESPKTSTTNQNKMDYSETIIQLHPPSTPLKASAMVEVVEQAVSPSLTIMSDRSGSSFMGGSSRAGSFSIPRIEDSLEELDKLEDELEAIDAVTHSGHRLGASQESMTNNKLSTSNDGTSTVSKRRPIIGPAATVRMNGTKNQPSIRRSTSLVFRDKKQERPVSSTEKTIPQLSRAKAVNSASTTPKPPIKSTKPPTVPNFELPGEAVARRLKGQREARLAQQSETQKTHVPPPRPRSGKPLTKPTFELPGEAISRRKREEREARLKAQEEEERKRREFKARPMRHSLAPSSLPRETITSLARQGKLPQETNTEKPSATMNPKRASMSAFRPLQANTIASRSPQTRGRVPTIAPPEDMSRATSTSTSSSGKRNALSTEQLLQLKLRGKEIFERDNSSFAQDKERARLEREAATKLAREQAAERSRALSREWAEKKRRKEQALKEAMKAAAV